MLATKPRIDGGRRDRGYHFALPWLAGFLLLYAGPMVVLGLLSCMSWDGLSTSTLAWTGSENVQRLWNDRLLRTALLNSVAYTAMNVPAQLIVALGLALLIHRARRVGFWATLYYLPHVLGGVATILVWWWLLNPQVGPINRALGAVCASLDWPARSLGLASPRSWPTPPWLYSPSWAKPSLVLMNIWQAGGGMLIFLAALLRGDETLREAAALDGAGAFRRFLHVTLPLLSPAIMFNALTGVIFSMQEFDQPFLLSNFQQQNSLLFYVFYLYQTAFERQQFGYAAALAAFLLLALIAFTAATVRLTRRWVHYEMEGAL